MFTVGKGRFTHGFTEIANLAIASWLCMLDTWLSNVSYFLAWKILALFILVYVGLLVEHFKGRGYFCDCHQSCVYLRRLGQQVVTMLNVYQHELKSCTLTLRRLQYILNFYVRVDASFCILYTSHRSLLF